MFEEKVGDQAVKAYFESMDLDVWDAPWLLGKRAQGGQGWCIFLLHEELNSLSQGRLVFFTKQRLTRRYGRLHHEGE